MGAPLTKIDPRARRRLARAAPGEVVECMVRAEPPITDEHLAALAGDGIDVLSSTNEIIAVRCPRERLATLAAHPFVLEIDVPRPLFED